MPPKKPKKKRKAKKKTQQKEEDKGALKDEELEKVAGGSRKARDNLAITGG